MTFEWDPRKAAENLEKHGIPFDYATRVFDDPYRIEQEDQTGFYEETRYRAIGMVENLLLFVAFTYRLVRTIYVLFPLGRRPLVNEDNIMKFERDPDRQPTLTPEQRARLEAMTDADVEAAALADPDAQPLTEEQLAQFERVPNIKAIREKLHLSQKQFAETFGLSLSVVRDWEQGRFFPDRAARTLLKVIAHNPQAVQEALAHPE